MQRPATAVAIGCLLFTLASCSRGTEPVAAARFVEPDRLFEKLVANVHLHPEFEVIADIDHARLAQAAGIPMPPSHVLIFSDAELDAAILQLNPVAALDLPVRILAFENQSSGRAAVIANSYDFLARRHGLPEDGPIRARYEAAIAKAIAGIPADSISRLASGSMQNPGVVMLDSPYDFATTEKNILMAIDAQPDTVHFAKIDFAARSRARGVELEPALLILFGAPGPGGRAMAHAPSLGLDAFCQKLLIWQDADGVVRVSFNDLVALAERQPASGGIPLRVINRRLKHTFSAALEP